MTRYLLGLLAVVAALAFTGAAFAQAQPASCVVKGGQVLAVKGGRTIMLLPARGIARRMCAGFVNRTNQRAAGAAVRAAIPAAEAYFADTGSYAGMNLRALRFIDRSVDVDQIKVYDGGKTYCVQKTVGGQHAYAKRGLASIGGGDVRFGGVCW